MEIARRKNSRTKNSFFNFVTSIGGQTLTIVMQFIVRSVFIKTLGESYLGITGLFSNILSMLSLVELGVGNAILFKLYSPIAQGNYRRISVLMKFYKQIYSVIGIVIALIGVGMIPFLPMLINDYEKVAELGIPAVLIFLLYLCQSVSSYLFFAYKSAIVKANQKEYLLTVLEYGITIGSSILQIVLLTVFCNFILYVLVLIGTTIIKNLIYARLADKLYPEIDYKVEESLSRKEATGIAKDCYALFLFRINGVVQKAMGNIILSAVHGLSAIALYSNYHIFYTSVKSLFVRIYGSIAHSLGNLHTSKDSKHEYRVFENIFLITVILGGTAFVGISVVVDDFVHAWLGETWILPQPFAVLLGFEIFTMALREVLGKYRTTMGLFQQAKYRPIVEAFLNLSLSVFLTKLMGIPGVVLGELIAGWVTFAWYDPIIIHKYGFGEGFYAKRYFGKLIKYLATLAAICALDLWLCSYIIFENRWISVVIKAIICGITTPCALIAVTAKTEECKYVLGMGRRYLGKVQKKIKKGE